MSAHGPDEYLPVESAGSVAGISPRTLRYWIKGGKLPATEGQRGKLVRLGDVLALAEMTGKRAADGRQSPGTAGNPATSAESTAGNAAGSSADAADQVAPAVTPAAVAQLEAIRDQWIRPFVDRIGELERENGRLEERIMGTERERNELRAEVELLRSIGHAGDGDPHSGQDAVVEPAAAPGRADPPDATDTPREAEGGSWLAILWRRVRGS